MLLWHLQSWHAHATEPPITPPTPKPPFFCIFPNNQTLTSILLSSLTRAANTKMKTSFSCYNGKILLHDPSIWNTKCKSKSQ
ncbi:hypothetical protein VIGAN_08226900 [Vigna angularis var. angularis]|uniref:Uncharacterized protein n=1 Tax=Vigna angularis var. angularis TaxID=157739 RepID=A0A0S3SRR4_PHAAN|nr:hypothetical protein VIGAN_08226900 [Vigna angularis var. angularis]